MRSLAFVRYTAAGALAFNALGCDSGAQVVEAAGSGTAPAVMVAVQSRSPEGSNFYVGAYPELPAQLDLAEMIETPSGQNATAFGGYIYIWSAESGIYSRYAVDDALRLSTAGNVSFMNLGGTGNVMTSFISPTRAYSMTRDNLQIIAWNPSDMTVIGNIDTSGALDPLTHPSHRPGARPNPPPTPLGDGWGQLISARSPAGVAG